MGCGHDLIKKLLIFINAIFFLAGGALLGGGLFIRFEPSIQEYASAAGLNLLKDELYLAAYILIAFGGLTFLVGFLGCCGAVRSSKCLIVLYILFVVAIIAAEVAGGVYVAVNKDKVMNTIEDEAIKVLKTNYTSSKSLSDKGWNTMMRELKCCGVKGVADFTDSIFQNQSRDFVPESCCKYDGDLKNVLNKTQCQVDAKMSRNNTASLNGLGCLDALEDLLIQNSTILLGIGVGIGAFELIVLFMAIGFVCTIKKD